MASEHGFREQYSILLSYADQGDYAGGWEYLASIGDSYADNAYAVATGNGSGLMDLAMTILVQKHWENTAGPDAYAQKFDQVARQHFQQYVEYIGNSPTHELPDSQEIEQSYRDAVTDAGLPPETAFDGVYTRSWGDLADALYPGLKSSGWDWTDWLGMEDARQVESNVFDDIDRLAAWEMILKDMWHTAEALVQLGFNDAADAWRQMHDDAARSFLHFSLGLSNSLDGFILRLQTLFASAEATASPLILDLDGDGVETLSKAAGIHFDHDGNGFAELTGWVGKDDGLLVLDRNGNGQIDDGSELFGNNTLLSSGQKAANGFTALAELDGNGDGRIDAQDAAFADLRIWRDADSDGLTDAGELLTLEEAGVLSLNTGYTTSTTKDANGNAHKQIGSYETGTAGTAAMNDVWFAADYARTPEQVKIVVA